MSLFGAMVGVGDSEDDPFFGSHMQSLQRINNMMNSMFADPFGMMGQMQMMPVGFLPMQPMSMGRMFSDMENMGQNPNCHSYTSSSIMTMTSGTDGRPQVYQESMSTLTAPGGVKETKKTVSDSRTGTRKMAIGHHIGERAHILERQQNMHNGEQEELQEFINLGEEEAETFNKEWESRSKRSMGAINAPYRQHNPYTRGQQENKQLALPSTVPTSNRQSKHPSRSKSSPRRAIRPSHSSRPSTGTSTSRSVESTSTSTSSNSKSTPLEIPQNLTTSSRKRERTPDPEDNCNSKRQSTEGTTDD